MTAPVHLAPAALGRIAAGDAIGAGEAAHLAACADCRRALARVDPTALFGLLGALPPAWPEPAYPVLDLPVRRPAVARRAGLAAAAGLLAALALWTASRPPAPPPVQAAALPAPGEIPEIVTHVDSKTARIVTLVPARNGGGEGPTVTLIVDAGLEF